MENGIRNLMFDLAERKTIFDVESNRTISTDEANTTLREYCFSKLGLNEKSSDRDIKRALKKPEALEFFAVIEEILDKNISTGWKNNEFFNAFVDEKNIADGDINEFWTEDDIILNVAKISGDSHDLIMQKLAGGTSYNVPTSVFGVKVGTDIRMFLTNRKNWSDFIDAVSKAYVNKIQTIMYTEFMNAASKLPVVAGFKGTGALSSTVKADFDQIISNVATANESEVVIMGTKVALKKLNALADVDWISQSQKEAVANTGILGTYEGVTLIEIPQRFANNKPGTEMVDSTRLLIFPVVDYKPIKFVDYGETTLEVTEAGDTMNDQQSYEAQRRMGVGTVITRYFGDWDIDG